MKTIRTLAVTCAFALCATSVSAQSVYLTCVDQTTRSSDAQTKRQNTAICACVARALKDASITRKEEAELMRNFQLETAGKIIDRVPGLKASSEKCMRAAWSS